MNKNELKYEGFYLDGNNLASEVEHINGLINSGYGIIELSISDNYLRVILEYKQN